MDVLFWSGGKDAYLALEFYRQENPQNKIRLLTTYEKETARVPHQNIPLSHIRQQAEALELELIPVSLPSPCPNDLYLEKVKEALYPQPEKIKNLIFGDWYLHDIRQWREEQFIPAGYSCRFPIWQKELDELLPVLLLKGVEIYISAVRDEFRNYIKVGERYNQLFVRQLPETIDPMGEKGEFHTEVIFEPRHKHPGDEWASG